MYVVTYVTAGVSVVVHDWVVPLEVKLGVVLSENVDRLGGTVVTDIFD